MNREKAYVTADDKLRVPSLSGESLHEYSAKADGILYRSVTLDGSPRKGRVGLWKTLSPNGILKHLITCQWQPVAAAWFMRHGITSSAFEASMKQNEDASFERAAEKGEVWQSHHSFIAAS